MDIKCSKEFMDTISELLEQCSANDTDSITISIDYPTVTLEMDVTFRVEKR